MHWLWFGCVRINTKNLNFVDILSGCRCWRWIWISVFRPAHFLNLILNSEPPIENSNETAKSKWRYTTDWAHKLPLWQHQKGYTGYEVVRSLPLNNRSKRTKKRWHSWLLKRMIFHARATKWWFEGVFGKDFFIIIIIFEILFIIKSLYFSSNARNIVDLWILNEKFKRKGFSG